MRVQVKRRRESAGFLAGFVGAQGELLVDTTNNRVQVHDGATPGGFPAARLADLVGRNLVINGNFAVNQRGYASGSALAANVYSHDRWKGGAGGCTYSFAQAVPDTAVTIAAGSLVQAVEGYAISSPSFILSWTGSAKARVWQGSASGSFAASPIQVSGLLVGSIASLEFQGGSLGLAQFEAALPSAGPTLFERRQLAQELAYCQRYYAPNATAAGGWGTTTTLTVAFTFPVSMRAPPTLLLLNGSVNGGSAVEIAVAQHVVSSISASAVNATGGRADLVTSAVQAAQRPGILEAGTLAFSAEI